MNFRNLGNWKATMKRIANERNLDVQDVQQRYVLEEFAKKIGASEYNDLLILKGGFVVSTVLGLDTRMTRDLDITWRSTLYHMGEVRSILESIVKIQTTSFFEYSLVSLKQAQEDDCYSGFVAVIQAIRDATHINLKIDISNNTLIFPEAINTSLKSLFDEDCIQLRTYCLENIIAEKYETTLDRGEFNTRIRDLFDIYLLMKEHHKLIDKSLLAQTIVMVSKDRGTFENLNEFDDILHNLLNSAIFKKNFQRYKEQQYPQMDITLDNVFNQFKCINEIVIKYKGV